MAGGRVKGTGHERRTFSSRATSAHFHDAEPILPRAGAVKDGAFQRRRRLVLDGCEHGRTMIDRGDASFRAENWAHKKSRFPNIEKRCGMLNTMNADERGNDRNPNGPRPATAGLGRAALPPRDRA